VVAAPVRTPIGRFGGGLAGLSAADLGAAVAAESLRRSGVPPERVDEAIFGCARQAGVGPNVARQIGWRSGLPESRPAFTVNMACGSGLKALDLGFRAIRHGEAQIVLAGGSESMSRVPYLLTGARWGHRMGNSEVADGMYRDGFMCPLSDMVMGETAEELADRYSIGRREQDEFALRSQQRAASAWAEGRFEAETVAVKTAGRRGATLVDRDEHPRPDTTMADLERLRPVFRPDGGRVTAGNSSGITDGAAALLLLSSRAAGELGVEAQARVLGVATAGVDPRIMGIGVVPAVRTLLDRLGRPLSDFELVEVNEAFAAQVLACDRELGFDPERLNVNGGAIALGHPIGSSGARIVVTLLHEMRRRGVRLGLAALCVSGGMGLAAAFEVV